jgi:prepilin-type processing-associated H-X9-DG protein
MPVDHGEFRIVKLLDKAAVDPTNPDVGSSGHPGGVNAVMGDGSVRFLNASITDSTWIDLGAPPADAGYFNPSSFQIISAGKGEAEHVSHQGWAHFEHYSHGTTPNGTLAVTKTMDMANTRLIGPGDPLGNTDAVGDPITFTLTISNPSSATAFPGFAGGISVASGDVNGDDGDVLVGAGPGAPGGHVKAFSGMDYGDLDTFDFQPQLTTEPTAPAGEVNHSEFTIVKLLDAATPKLFNDEASILDGTQPAMGDGSVRFLSDGLLLPAVRMESGDGGFADGHNDGGFVINWLPDSDDGGIIIDYTPGPDDDLENYDWPGEYAQRFDGVDKGGDTFDFQPQLTTEPTAPGEDVMGQNNLRIGDSFNFTDYKPTESLKADDNFIIIDFKPTESLVEEGHPGGANAVMGDGFLPASITDYSQTGDGLLLPY